MYQYFLALKKYTWKFKRDARPRSLVFYIPQKFFLRILFQKSCDDSVLKSAQNPVFGYWRKIGAARHGIWTKKVNKNKDIHFCANAYFYCRKIGAKKFATILDPPIGLGANRQRLRQGQDYRPTRFGARQ
jgi:hypothetical protein